MKIFLAGGTGFIGSHLVNILVEHGHELTVLVRSPRRAERLPKSVRVIQGNPMEPGPWQGQVGLAETVINLTGFNIFTRWTAASKKLIHDSRVLATRNIVDAIEPEQGPLMTLINASAAGYYGFGGDEEKAENAPPGDDFLARVCVDWENEAQRAALKNCRVITTRFGVVLGRGGGALAKMLPGFRLGIAGRLGSGNQWFPWIHLDDLAAIFQFLLDNPDIKGPVNCCAPQSVRNREFTKTLGMVLHRPTPFPVPAFVLRLVLGELGSVVLHGNRMVPDVLVRQGFQFQHPELEGALRHLLSG